MPLTRYQIRNEYSLADPELYRAADREDPEAILEGVAMAGLVGVLRQLGDLAEFAAEIFHELHEEVMVTAARGHGLMVRVQQLEAEFPSIEKAFLSQTNHSSFFSNAGIDWHPNLHTEQNLLTRGDLPRCVMDSYEECRGPPRLFLLDKFDGAGAGACLKRYTDPSFFKAESASSGIATVEVHREKKVRKAKKKGSRWRNGGTPEILPTSHPKLLQLFLEERVENGFSDPARLVKLKKRQLNRSLLDSKSGKSYMEKFLGTPSPEHKEVCEIPAAPPPLKLTPDNSSESGLEVLEIGTVGPVKKSLQGKESPRSSPNAQEVLVKPSMEELNEDVIDREIVKVSEPTAYGEIHEIPSTLPKVMVEKELAVDGEGNTEGSVDGDHYDDVASEVDNYMDALTTMESEMDTDNEYRHKNNLGFLNVEKHGIDSDANEEQLEVQGHFSDTQSIENSTVSDDGNSSFKKERSSFSYSDTLSNLAENTPSDSEAAAKVFPSTETCVAEIVDTPSNQLPVSEEILETKSHELVMLNDTCIDEGKIADPGEPSCSSCLTETNSLLLPLDPGVNSLVVLSVGPALNDTPSESVEFGSKLPNIDENRTNLADSSAAVSAIPSQTRDDCHFMDSAESNYLDELDVEDSNLSSDALLASEKKSSDVLQIDHTDETCAENLAEGKTGSPQSIISPAEDQFPCSALPIEELYSGITLLLDSSDVVRPDDLVSEMGDAMQATGGSSESLTPTVDTSEAFDKQKFSDIKDDVPQAVLDSKEVGVPYSEENTNLDEISRTADGEETGGFNYKVDAVEGDAVPLELPSNCPDNPGLDDHISSDDIVAETAEADVTMSAAAAAASAGDDVNDVYCSSPDLSSNDIVTETVKADVAISAAASAGDDVNDVVCPSPDLSSVDIVTENVKADVAMSAAAAAAATGAGDDINDVVCPSPDLICSPSRRSVNFPESPSGSGNLYQEGLEFNEAFSPEYVLESKAEKELNQLEVAPTDLDSFPCKSVSYGYSNDVIFDDVHDSPLVEQPQNSSHVSDVTTAPASSEPNNQELESESLHQSHPLENGKDAVFSPTCSTPGNKIILEQSLNLQADQVEVECWEADEASFKSSNLWSEQLQSLNHRDQARCFDASSECCPEDFPNQPLSSEFLPQSTGQELDGTKRAMDSLVSVLPSFGLLPEGAQVSVGEMPPLPPLPPMQWRIGKVQHAPLAMERELVEHSQQSFPSILPFTADEKAQFGFPALGGVIVPPGNPFLPVEAVEDERPQHVSEQLVDHLAQPTTLSSQLPTMVNDANGRHNSLALEGIESLNPFLTLPAISTERPEQGFLALESEMTRPSSNPFASIPAVEYTTSRHDVVSSQENLTQPLNLLAPETGLEAKSLQHAPQNSEGEHGNSFVTSLSPPTNVEEQPQHDLPISEGQTAWTIWPSNTLALPPTFEVGKPNGNPPAKLPRPRSPLVDALAAHDKSMLRKVTERVRPQIGSKVDERDSLLEQIRTKSFNLKPAMVSRPSIQGPKTNLKVAAILEKANAIRQALAGSDEDDDEDNWSDS